MQDPIFLKKGKVVIGDHSINFVVYDYIHYVQNNHFNRTYEFRCVLPLLNSTIRILHRDYRAPEIEMLLQVRAKFNYYNVIQKFSPPALIGKDFIILSRVLSCVKIA